MSSLQTWPRKREAVSENVSNPTFIYQVRGIRPWTRPRRGPAMSSVGGQSLPLKGPNFLRQYHPSESTNSDNNAQVRRSSYFFSFQRYFRTFPLKMLGGLRRTKVVLVNVSIRYHKMCKTLFLKLPLNAMSKQLGAIIFLSLDRLMSVCLCGLEGRCCFC